MAAELATARGISMPADLDNDGKVAYWILGTIARVNSDDRWADITVNELAAFDDADWDGLAGDTPEIDGPLTDAQRARIRSELEQLETDDRGQAAWWWDR